MLTAREPRPTLSDGVYLDETFFGDAHLVKYYPKYAHLTKKKLYLDFFLW